jgi:hypothetical protein
MRAQHIYAADARPDNYKQLRSYVWHILQEARSQSIEKNCTRSISEGPVQLGKWGRAKTLFNQPEVVVLVVRLR